MEVIAERRNECSITLLENEQEKERLGWDQRLEECNQVWRNSEMKAGFKAKKKSLLMRLLLFLCMSICVYV